MAHPALTSRMDGTSIRAKPRVTRMAGRPGPGGTRWRAGLAHGSRAGYLGEQAGEQLAAGARAVDLQPADLPPGDDDADIERLGHVARAHRRLDQPAGLPVHAQRVADREGIERVD